MNKKKKKCQYRLLCLAFLVLAMVGCNGSIAKKEAAAQAVATELPKADVKIENELTEEQIAKEKFRAENKAWIDEHIDKDFLLGKVRRNDNPLFVKVGEEHTKRNIHLIPPAYDAFKAMYEAAKADSVKLIITSGHRTYGEQVSEWELRWNNPGVDTTFANDVEKARFVLRYRSMPGTSRHHWGTDIDLNSFHLSYFETKEGKKMYNWLKENAATYGFYQSYTPLGENRPHGYQEEKWHWSYKPLASLMLAKYLELVSIDEIHGFKGDGAIKKLPVIKEWVCGIDPVFFEED